MPFIPNELLTIGPITIYAYGLMIGIGVIAAYLAAHVRAPKLGLETDKLIDLILYCVVFGFLSAKLLFWITIIDEIIANPSIMLDFSNGFVVYGGIIGGCVTGWIFCKIHKYNFLRYADLILPSVALAQAFGRVGCSVAGCCYGVETTSRFAVIYETSSFAPNGVGLVPTQLISTGLNLLHFVVLIFIASKVKKPGFVSACYLIFYSIGRFGVEMFRGDLNRGQVGEVSTSQFISLFVVLVGVVLLIISLRAKPQAEQISAEKTENTDSAQ